MFLFVPSGDKTRTQSMVSIVFVVVVVLVLLTNTLQKESVRWPTRDNAST